MDEMIGYYEGTNEGGRLFGGSGMLELERSKEIISRYLTLPARIVDIGGGPGIYAAWLTSLGHEVHLLDPVPKHLKEAARYPLASFQNGDARLLPWESQWADAALLMGPLYHLPALTDRLEALREAHRVLKPGGMIFAAAIGRWASLMHSLVDGFLDEDDFYPILQRDLEEGLHRNDTGKPQYFTTSNFHRPQELAGELETAGFCQVEVIAVEGPCWLAKDFDERWADPPRRARLLDLVRKVEKEPALMGSSMHYLAVGWA